MTTGSQKVSNWLTGDYKVKVDRDADNNVIQVVTVVPSSTASALTPLAPNNATIGTSSGQIIAANANRRGLTICNLSSNRLFLGLGTAALSAKGICIQPGWTWEMEAHNFTTAAINGLASGAGSIISYQEFE